MWIISGRGDIYRSCKRSEGRNWGKFDVTLRNFLWSTDIIISINVVLVFVSDTLLGFYIWLNSSSQNPLLKRRASLFINYYRVSCSQECKISFNCSKGRLSFDASCFKCADWYRVYGSHCIQVTTLFIITIMSSRNLNNF